MARLNDRELAAMQSPVRRLTQRHIELPTFVRMLDHARIDLAGARILEVGCGNGFGLSLLYRRFTPRRLVGIDLMPEQLAYARDLAPRSAELALGDVTALDFPDASFDAVFTFGILHHVPGWRGALGEIARVLAPGGVLLIEEIEGRGVDLEDRWLGTSHPRDARFDWPAFRAGLHDAGFQILDERTLVPRFVHSFLARAG
jgi:ubiquinone/menaquinone biosynthesis C-methylase UbiE